MLVTWLCLTLCDPVDCSPPGSSICGIFQARTVEWLAISYSFWPRNWTCISCVCCKDRQILYHCTSWETRKPPVRSQNSWSVCCWGGGVWFLLPTFLLLLGSPASFSGNLWFLQDSTPSIFFLFFLAPPDSTWWSFKITHIHRPLTQRQLLN